MTRGRLLALAGPGIAVGIWLALGLAGLRLTLPPAERAAVDAAVEPLVASHGVLVAAWWAAGAALAAWVGARLHATWAGTAARMTDTTRTMIGAGSAPDIIPEGAAPMRVLATAINGLAGRRRELNATIAEQISTASDRVAQQRDQLAALMAELRQSVVVCNLEGRILLYNDRATALSRAVSRAPGASRGAELIGLGRAIHGLVDTGQIAHALETVERRLAGGETSASARFVTATPAGHLLRVLLAPVRSGEAHALSGYVLLLDDITLEQEEQARLDRRMLELTEASRASVASVQAALDMLDYPDLEPAEREGFQGIVRAEVTAMSARLDRLAGEAAADGRARWPLQEMRGADLLAAAARRIEAETGRPAVIGAVDAELWLNVDGFALIQALAFLAGRLAPAPALLRLAPAGGRGHLDLAWDGDGVEVEALRRWQSEPMSPDAALTVRDVVERHGGELWLEQDRTGGRAFFRFLLPLAEAEESREAAANRPEYYDFDLFAASAESRALDDRPLASLACTVFDTETTGLDPKGGDEIIQIGALRVLNGKLLSGEAFDTLVDPRRHVPEAGVAIHGITQAMVRGQPTIAEALPAFHAFASDTVLVGHNVAFDMRFFALKEAETGVRFDQPLLDTLLLASLAWPNETSHGLDVIAGRLGVTVSGRHNALGDARATAEVFLGLMPLLREHGIETFGQAREASRTTYYASLRY